jgi:hypothetical protein
MHRRHEPARLVRSNRQQRKVRRSELFPNLREMGPERGVSREIRDAFLAFNHIPAPQGHVAIVNSPAEKCRAGTQWTVPPGQRQGLAPIQLVHGSYFFRAQQLSHSNRNNELRISPRRQPQRR